MYCTPYILFFDTSGDICTYWHKVSQLPDGRGGKTYECLTHVAKAVLTLSHSNAIPDRGFSVNKAMLGKEQLSLGENTIAALCIVKDTVRLFGSATSVPITKDLLTAARKAHSEYQLYLEEQQRQKAAELHKDVELEKELEEKRQLKNKEDSLLQQLRKEEKAELEQKHELATAKELIYEASTKMTAAIEQKNMQSVLVVQMMLNAGNEKLQETSKKLDLIWANQKVSENDLMTVIT